MSLVKQTSDLLPAKLLIELSLMCNEARLANQVRSLYVKRIGRINSELSVVLDKKNSYELTAFLVADVLLRKSRGESTEGVKDQDLPALINSLREYASDGDFESFRDIQRIADAMKQLGLAIPVISNPRLQNSGDGYQLRWSFVDVFGRPDDVSRKVSLAYDGKSADSSDNQAIIRTQKKDLSVEITQTATRGLKFATRHYVYPSEQLRLKEIYLALTKGNERIKEYAYTEGSTIVATQDNKLHIQLKIDKNVDPEYSAFYLKHTEVPQYERISSASSLTYNPDQSSFISSSEVYRNYRPW